MTDRVSAAGLRRRLAGWLVLASLWAAGQLLSEALPWTLVAVGLAAVLVAALAHALTIGLYLRLVNSIARTLRLAGWWQSLGASVAVYSIGLTYWLHVRRDGLPRQLTVEAVYLLGVAVYHVRSDLLRELQARLARVTRWD